MKRSNKIIPPVYFLFTIMIMSALHHFFPLGRILNPPFTFTGVIFIVTGLIVAIWSAMLFGKAGTPVRPFETSTQLVTGGMYQITRNPMYSGMVLVLLGIALWLGTLSPFIPIPVFIWIIQSLFIVHEETMLENTFGDQYKNYRNKVRRWL